MNKKVFIKQDGTIPSGRIIAELQRYGGLNIYNYDDWPVGYCYCIGNTANEITVAENGESDLSDYTELLYDKETDSFYKNCRMEDFEKSEYNKKAFEQISNNCSDCVNDKGCVNCQDGAMKETHWGEEAPSAQEATKSMRMVSAEAKETLLEWEDIWLSSMLKNANNNLCLTIPEGYEAKIEDGKVIISKKQWQPKVGDSCYSVELYADTLAFTVTTFEIVDANDLDFYKRGTLFPTEDQAHAFCRKLNNAIRQVAEERRKEVEG